MSKTEKYHYTNRDFRERKNFVKAFVLLEGGPSFLTMGDLPEEATHGMMKGIDSLFLLKRRPYGSFISTQKI